MKRFGITGTVRASFALYNTKEEINTFAQSVEKAVGMLR
jgi:cysteine desulfurase/selenocysteine lyase